MQCDSSRPTGKRFGSGFSSFGLRMPRRVRPLSGGEVCRHPIGRGTREPEIRIPYPETWNRYLQLAWSKECFIRSLESTYAEETASPVYVHACSSEPTRFHPARPSPGSRDH